MKKKVEVSRSEIYGKVDDCKSGCKTGVHVSLSHCCTWVFTRPSLQNFESVSEDAEVEEESLFFSGGRVGELPLCDLLV